MLSGQFLLVVVFVFCLVDLAGFVQREGRSVNFNGYLAPILFGVALQFFGSAVGHLQFDSGKGKPKLNDF